MVRTKDGKTSWVVALGGRGCSGNPRRSQGKLGRRLLSRCPVWQAGTRSQRSTICQSQEALRCAELRVGEVIILLGGLDNQRLQA